MLVATDIIWDYEGCEEIILPTEIEVPYGMTKTEISAFLSDITGFCSKSFKVAYVD